MKGESFSANEKESGEPMSDDEINFRLLAENSIDILWNVRLDHVVRYVSPSLFPLLGWKPEEMTGKIFDNFVWGLGRK